LPGSSGKVSRVLRAPISGYVEALIGIGDYVHGGQVLAIVRSPDTLTGEVVAPFDGVLRGIVHHNVAVKQGMKIGDVDPRAEKRHCFTISDKSLAIGGGVLEAILTAVRTA
jgi:xanthine dehydrogenase accessory factor